mgnify:CR=1 FL=1|jgi:uncharacterized Fe-S cluster-containing protein|tara:strand:- start:22 stop:201 length:180 start_codon:yes stop_codon:yes gene_type:complete
MKYLQPVPENILVEVDRRCEEHGYKSGLLDGFRASQIYAENPDFETCVTLLVDIAKLSG